MTIVMELSLFYAIATLSVKDERYSDCAMLQFRLRYYIYESNVNDQYFANWMIHPNKSRFGIVLLANLIIRD